ncbi:hypothetical protein ACVWZW_000377 [Bradyrhizobium sp. F1.13.4]
MVLPLPSVTRLPLTPEPDATAVEAGAEPERNVMVLPFTVSVSPSAGWALPARPVAVVPLVAIRVMVPPSAVVPLPAVAPVLAKLPMVAPRVVVPLAAVVPPAVPLYSTLLLAVALAKLVVPRKSAAVAPAIVVETLDLVE